MVSKAQEESEKIVGTDNYSMSYRRIQITVMIHRGIHNVQDKEKVAF